MWCLEIFQKEKNGLSNVNEAADDIYNNQSHLDKVILTYLYEIFTSYLQYLLDIDEIFIEY